MYTITHHYLTTDDDGAAILQIEKRDARYLWNAVAIIGRMIANPGGGSGTTVTIVVSLNTPVGL